MVDFREVHAALGVFAAALLAAVSTGCDSKRCLKGATFGDPAESDYVLPYSPGVSRLASQSYCTPRGSHSDQLAYDFDMPIGSEVLAARAGMVRKIRESSPDDGSGEGRHNYVMVRHADGTEAFYAHLQQNGVLVEQGERVVIGPGAGDR